MIEVHVSFSGWRKWPEANAWGMHDDGTLRLVQTSGAPDWEFQRWVAVFPPGTWQGMSLGDGVQENKGKYGFQVHQQPPGQPPI